MSWSSVQTKYELIRVTEILQAWAKFKKSKILNRVTKIRDILLTEKLANSKLVDFREELVAMILATNDMMLINDLKSFTSFESIYNQQNSGVPEYS